MKNKYIKNTHISEAKISRPTINRFYKSFRVRIAELCEIASPFTNGEIELDESYFGARRVRGIRGCGAKGKIPVFGILKRGDKVYTQIVKNCSIKELLPIIKGKATADSIIYSDGFKTYYGLVNYGYKEYFRVKHSKNEFASGNNHINGIENFWGLCKVRLAKFRGVHKHTFYLHIKECEFRYNCRSENLYVILLKELRKPPINLLMRTHLQRKSI